MYDKDAYKEREREKGLEKENRQVSSLWREERSYNSAGSQNYGRPLGPQCKLFIFLNSEKKKKSEF